jgi:hypothetical protein
MNRCTSKAFERTRKSALEGVSMSTRRSSTSLRFWSRFERVFIVDLYENKNAKLSRTHWKRTDERQDGNGTKFTKKERGTAKQIPGIPPTRNRGELRRTPRFRCKEEEDFKPPTRAFSLREKTFREKRGEELNRLLPKEINGPRGLEPTRFKDWEVGGRCTDF